MILKYIALVSAFNLLLSALLVVSMPVLIKQTWGWGTPGTASTRPPWRRGVWPGA